MVGYTNLLPWSEWMRSPIEDYDRYLKEFCEKEIVQPTFVYGHPTSISPLAKMNDEAEKRLAKINKECLIIDLASKPGGIDFEAESVLIAPKATEVSEEERQTVADMMRRLGL